MSGFIRCIKFSGDHDKFYEHKEKTKAIERHKGILEYIKKECETPKEEHAEDNPHLLKIYEVNIKAWYDLITSLMDIPLWLERQFNENEHEARKEIIDKYEVSD